MKRKVGILGIVGLGALALGIYVGGVVWMQLPAEAAPTSSVAARTRVALVNLEEVFKNYRKFQVFKDQFKARADGYEQTLKQKQQRMEALQNEYKKPETSQQRKEQIESEARSIKLEMEDVRQKAQKDLLKFNQDQVSILYREVDAVVREYAGSNGIDLIFRYSEDWNQETYNNPENIVRRLGTHHFWPMYYDKSLDITAQVVQILNSRYQGTAATPAPSSGVQPTQYQPSQYRRN